MLTQEQNDALTRTNPGTDGGELLRRYWQPIALSSEVTAAAAAGSGRHPRRRARALPRSAKSRRLARPPLLSSRYRSLLRAARRRRPPLSLSRLALRRYRKVSRAAGRAEREHVQRQSAPDVLSGARTRRRLLLLHGSGRCARVSELRLLHVSRAEHSRAQALHRLQLLASERGQLRSLARRLFT